MEQAIITNNTGQMTVLRRKPLMPPDPVIEPHQLGGEPKAIGELMEPIQRIIDHPNRSKLLADFFKRNW